MGDEKENQRDILKEIHLEGDSSSIVVVIGIVHYDFLDGIGVVIVFCNYDDVVVNVVVLP